MLPLILFLLFLAGIETYSYFGLKNALIIDPRTIKLIYLGSITITLVGIFLLMSAFNGAYANIPFHINFIFSLAFAFIISKLLASTIFLVEDIFRSFAWLFQSAIKFRLAEWSSRSLLSGLLASGMAAIVILGVNYGVLLGRYQFKTHHLTLEFDNLPAEFDGFKIAQISDLHLGTFDQMKRVQNGLNQLQKENPDVILFTGDMVNNRAEEALAFAKQFGNLKAPYGKYSVLGNHDYGEYARWNSAEEKTSNLEKLKQIHGEMGFRLLLNENIALKNNNDAIFLAGVENWGEPPFPQYGDLAKSTAGLNSNDFIVLLSHDPTHWRQKILKQSTNIELTLSGHTHGMQFGIEIGNFRWSPVKYRYPDWAGLFTEGKMNLYVNRGFGSIGFPGRIGILPEITIIELKRKR